MDGKLLFSGFLLPKKAKDPDSGAATVQNNKPHFEIEKDIL